MSPAPTGDVVESGRTWEVSGTLCRWGLCGTEVALNIPAEGWQPGDVVKVELDSEVGGFVLSVPVTEKVKVR